MKQITQVPHVCIIFKESSGLWITCVINLLGCQDLQLIFWDKHTSVIPFWNRQDKVYPPNTIWDQINSLHFQSFKALNLIWSQKKKRVSKLLKKHFKSIKFLFFFPDFSRLQGWGGWVRPNLENSRFFFWSLPLMKLKKIILQIFKNQNISYS